MIADMTVSLSLGVEPGRHFRRALEGGQFRSGAGIGERVADVFGDELVRPENLVEPDDRSASDAIAQAHRHPHLVAHEEGRDVEDEHAGHFQRLAGGVLVAFLPDDLSFAAAQRVMLLDLARHVDLKTARKVLDLVRRGDRHAEVTLDPDAFRVQRRGEFLHMVFQEVGEILLRHLLAVQLVPGLPFVGQRESVVDPVFAEVGKTALLVLVVVYDGGEGGFLPVAIGEDDAVIRLVAVHQRAEGIEGLRLGYAGLAHGVKPEALEQVGDAVHLGILAAQRRHGDFLRDADPFAGSLERDEFDLHAGGLGAQIGRGREIDAEGRGQRLQFRQVLGCGISGRLVGHGLSSRG
jgi:hypothetical protein